MIGMTLQYPFSNILTFVEPRACDNLAAVSNGAMARHTPPLSSMNSAIGNIFRLDGKVALVAGGYGGIGEPVCQALAASGAKVAVAGQDAAKAAACAESLTALGTDAWSGSFDACS